VKHRTCLETNVRTRKTAPMPSERSIGVRLHDRTQRSVKAQGGTTPCTSSRCAPGTTGRTQAIAVKSVFVLAPTGLQPSTRISDLGPQALREFARQHEMARESTPWYATCRQHGAGQSAARAQPNIPVYTQCCIYAHPDGYFAYSLGFILK